MMPLVALGASAAGARTRMAYLPLAEVVAEPVTVIGTGLPSLPSAFTTAAFGQALSHTLIPLTGLPSVPVTRPATLCVFTRHRRVRPGVEPHLDPAHWPAVGPGHAARYQLACRLRRWPGQQGHAEYCEDESYGDDHTADGDAGHSNLQTALSSFDRCPVMAASQMAASCESFLAGGRGISSLVQPDGQCARGWHRISDSAGRALHDRAGGACRRCR